VFDHCRAEWSAFCDDKRPEPAGFLDELAGYPFLVCAHGGGIDPSPKAWMALISGVIPIMQRFPGVEALYRGLPVAWVEDWNATAITEDRLRAWREELVRPFEDPVQWAGVLEKLQASYWAKLIAASYYTGVGYGYVPPPARGESNATRIQGE
jgi:hypothetical protein